MNQVELEALGDSLAASPAPEILARAVERFPRITFATGFGVEGCLLIDLIARNDLRVDLFTLDTGLLFPETYALWTRLEARYGVTIRAVRPERTVAEQAVEFGERLWEREPERCCGMRKVLPLRTALAPFEAWVSGIRRDQTRERAGVRVVEWDFNFGLVKVNPLALWSSDDVWSYVRRNEIPFNPLHEKGYPSIGCVPCTSLVFFGEDPRAGRWRGREKKECGIHARSENRAISWCSNREETSGDARIG
ncbi:MAG TPA: phosphoadenylyl-sulfate reductase [Thermoanaerobaculia bacterium]